jgi:hypothetical protein
MSLDQTLSPVVSTASRGRNQIVVPHESREASGGTDSVDFIQSVLGGVANIRKHHCEHH